jgi:hypothetical protein
MFAPSPQQRPETRLQHLANIFAGVVSIVGGLMMPVIGWMGAAEATKQGKVGIAWIAGLTSASLFVLMAAIGVWRIRHSLHQRPWR